jgi:hypothetical protein
MNGPFCKLRGADLAGEGAPGIVRIVLVEGGWTGRLGTLPLPAGEAAVVGFRNSTRYGTPLGARALRRLLKIQRKRGPVRGGARHPESAPEVGCARALEWLEGRCAQGCLVHYALPVALMTAGYTNRPGIILQWRLRL